MVCLFHLQEDLPEDEIMYAQHGRVLMGESP